MRQTKDYKHFIITLTFILIFSGCCQHFVTTDSVYEYKEGQPAVISEFRTSNTVIQVQESKKQQTQSYLPTSLMPLSVQPNLLFIWISLPIITILYFLEIIYYIHHQDGEKRSTDIQRRIIMKTN